MPSVILALFAVLCAALLPATHALAGDVLRPEQAFAYETAAEGGRLLIRFALPEGYYLYRSKFSFDTTTAGVRLEPAIFPPGELHDDEFFGQQEIYRGRFEIALPFTRVGGVNRLALRIHLQGCADIGLCYTPQSWTREIPLPAAKELPR